LRVSPATGSRDVAVLSIPVWSVTARLAELAENRRAVSKRINELDLLRVVISGSRARGGW